MPRSDNSFGSFAIFGCIVLALMGIVFHLLQEDNSMTMFAAFVRRVVAVNDEVAARLKITRWGVVRWELFGIGVALVSIKEWLPAITCWVLIAVIGVAVAFRRKEGTKQSLVLPVISSAGWVALAVLLIAMTTLKKPDNDSWSSLQTLWRDEEESAEIVGHPYDLTGERRKRFKELFKPSSDETDTLRVGCLEGSDSACVAAGQFLLLLSEVGWKIDSGGVVKLNAQIPTAGAVIAARAQIPRPANLPPHLGMWQLSDKSQTKLAKVFTQMGVPVRSGDGPDLPTGTIGVYFGPDPGPQTISLYMLLSDCEPSSESCDVLPDTAKTHGTFLTTGSEHQSIYADHPKCVEFQPEVSDKQFTVTQSELPRKLKLGRCVDHSCTLTILQFTEDKIVMDSRGATVWDEGNGKMGSVPIHWKLLGVRP